MPISDGQEKFLKLLFDPGQRTCFAPDAKGTEVKAQPGQKDVFFSINALSAIDNNPEQPWHDVSKPRRADHNVECCRNFLIELDNMPLSEQIDYVRSRIPVSAITFSGNKSYHFIISMQASITAEEYAKLANAIHRLLPAADKSTKNPSRLSRLPGVVRPDTKLVQELVYLGSRISVADLPEFPTAPTYYERKKPKDVVFVTQQLREVQEIGIDNYISSRFEGRNQFFYWLGKRCSELNHTREEKKIMVERFYDQMQNKSGFSIREAFAAARVKF